MFAATVFFSAMDVCNKHLTQEYPVGQVVWARFFFHLVVLAALLGPAVFPALVSGRPGLQAARSIFQALGTALFIVALAFLPLTDVNAIVFTMPIMVTLMSIPMLGERVGVRRWMGVLVGFVGALVVIRPGGVDFQPVILFPVVGAVALSIYQILTRQASRHDGIRTSLIYTPVVGAIVSSAFLPLFWVWPDPRGWVLMVLAGAAGAASHMCVIKAYERGPAAVVSPLLYATLIWATISGYVFFDHLPDPWTIAGAAIIAASGLYIAHRERRRTRDHG